MKRFAMCAGATALIACTTAHADFAEDWESHTAGANASTMNGWAGWWLDSGADAVVSTAQNNTPAGANSVDISAGVDLVREHTEGGTGTWEYSVQQYIPSGMTGTSYFIILDTYNSGGGSFQHNWAVQVGFDSSTGELFCDCGSGSQVQGVPYVADAWTEIRVIVDFDNDWGQVYYNDVLLDDPVLLGSGYQWTLGVFGNDNPAGSGQFGATDLFANGATAVYYDDISLAPAVGRTNGSCCNTTSEVCVDGVTEVDCLAVDNLYQEGVLCSEFTCEIPTAACCVESNQDGMLQCIGDLTEGDCNLFAQPGQIAIFSFGESCTDVNFSCPVIAFACCTGPDLQNLTCVGDFDADDYAAAITAAGAGVRRLNQFCVDSPCLPITPPSCLPANRFCALPATEGDAGNFGTSDATFDLERIENYSLGPPLGPGGIGWNTLRWYGVFLTFDGGFTEGCDGSGRMFNIAAYPDDGGGMPDLTAQTCINSNVAPTQTITNAIVTGLLANEVQFDVTVNCCGLDSGWLGIQVTDDGNLPSCVHLWASVPDNTGSSVLVSAGSITATGLGDLNMSIAGSCDKDCCVANIVTAGPSASSIDFDDLSLLLGFWGSCPGAGDPCQVANIVTAGPSANAIDFDDLSLLLGFWGGCYNCP